MATIRAKPAACDSEKITTAARSRNAPVRSHGGAKGRRWTRREAQKGPFSARYWMNDLCLFSVVYRQFADS
jgi:hypothetical protein